MDAQQDLLKAAEDFRQRLGLGEDDDDEGPAGEFQAAEYIIFTLAFDVYTRHLVETIAFHLAQKQERYNLAMEGKIDEDPAAIDEEMRQLEQHGENPTDEVLQAGVRLLKRLDRDLETFKGYMSNHLPGKAHQNLLNRTFRKPARSTVGVGIRAQGLKGLLNLGGNPTIQGLFDTKLAQRQIKAAIRASKLEDGDAALDQFAAMPVRNALIRKWLDWAAKTAKPLMAEGIPTEKLVNPVQEAATEAATQVAETMAHQAQEVATDGAEAAQEAADAQQAALTTVEQAATQKAREALEKSGEPDEPPARSEVVGIATAAAVAALSDVSNPRNIPEPLKKLDDEQRAAALTDGKVLIAAGAGAGKSTTLIARADYLVRERRVNPKRMLVTSFNTKAAEELKEKLGKSLGDMAPAHVGTMHKMFASFVRKYGTPREAAAMHGYKKTEGDTTRAAQAIWKHCFPDDAIPAAKQMKLYKTQWAGNNVSPRDAKEMAQGAEEEMAARWYEIYEGLKGALDTLDKDGNVTAQWKPPCEGQMKGAVQAINDERRDAWEARGANPDYEPKDKLTVFEAYMAKTRPGGKRVGDFDDMLKICHDVLERNPGARKAIQSRFDHVSVDECQDLNEVQHGVIRMMTEHITDGADGKSLWMVGDDKQSIYAFRGARPDLFTGLHEKEGWKTRMIRTNYRCAPEIVDAANMLIANNTGQIPMEANPRPDKARGEASIKVDTPRTEAEGAIRTVEEIKLSTVDMDEKETAQFYSENAVLCRTNKELHSFETACIIRGIPYARKGSGSFLGSRDTSAMLGYMNLIMGGKDPEAMQKAFINCIDTPNRFYTGTQTEEKVQKAIRTYANATGTYQKDCDPSKLIHDRTFQDALAKALGGSGWYYDQAMEKIKAMAATTRRLQTDSREEGFTTKDLFDGILGNFEGETNGTDDDGVPIKVTETLRESLMIGQRDFAAAGDDDDDDGDEADGEDDVGKLGNVAFLYMLMEPDPTDPEDILSDPRTPAGFAAKMERFEQKAADLRVDLKEHEEKMAKLPPDERYKPRAVYLGTVHSVKGAEWPNTYVQMPAGKFPFEPPPRDDEEMLTEEEMQKRAKEREEELETERRLAYVAITRAEEKLTIICPARVGGKPAGISPFVAEAGLTVGENVSESVAEGTGGSSEIKLAYDGPEPPDAPTPWDPSDFEGGA